MNVEDIKQALRHHRQQEAAYALYDALRLHGGAEANGPRMGQRIAVVRAWLRLLSEEERFVVTKHLVDGLPWPLVAVEYEARWGSQQVRHERTLKRLQQRALEKILATVGAHGLAAIVSALFTENG